MKSLNIPNPSPLLSAGKLMKKSSKKFLGILFISVGIFTTTCSAAAETTAALNVDTDLNQAVFSSPEAAAESITDAISGRDREKIGVILGLSAAQLLPLNNISQESVEKYLQGYAKSHSLQPVSEGQYLIAIGEENWTLPIPITKGSQGWYFDTEAGIERIRIRRIGRNEMATILSVLAYYDAQLEYAVKERDGDGVLEYAQKFISTDNLHDGLYWETSGNEMLSPLGPLFADTTPDGAYHGYYYRILTSQDANANGGAFSYLKDNQMTGGFALIAWPAEYGNTGVMSFIVNQDGIVYQQDLGPDTAELAVQIQGFDPAPGWAPVE